MNKEYLDFYEAGYQDGLKTGLSRMPQSIYLVMEGDDLLDYEHAAGAFLDIERAKSYAQERERVEDDIRYFTWIKEVKVMDA